MGAGEFAFASRVLHNEDGQCRTQRFCSELVGSKCLLESTLRTRAGDLSLSALRVINRCDKSLRWCGTRSRRNLERLLEISKSSSPQAILSDQCDYSRYAQAWLCEQLGLAGPTLESVAPTVNKLWLRDFCASANVRQPAYVSARSYDEAKRAVAELVFPVIVKPVDNRGSFGVTRVERLDQLRQAVANALAVSHSRQVVIEEFIAGTVVTVDGAHLDGNHLVLGVASKRQVEGPHPVAMEIIYPAELPDGAIRQARQLADSVAVVLAGAGATGLTHTEMIWDGSEMWLVESANRGGGVRTSSILLPALTGFDVNEYLLSEATGTAFTAPEIADDRACELRFFELRPGTIGTIEGDVGAEQGVVDFGLWVEPGDRVDPVTNATQRNGYLIVAADSRERARSLSEGALQKLSILDENGHEMNRAREVHRDAV